MRTRRVLALVLAAVLLAAAAAHATVIYITDGDNSTVYRVDLDAGTFTSWSSFLYAYPIAVADTVRLGQRDNGGGAEYALDGTPTGVTWGDGPRITQLLDGTTDSVSYNYAVSCCDDNQGGPGVYRFDRLWGNAERLFAIGDESGGTGIAYDPANRTLWVLRFSRTIVQYSLDGQVISSIPAPGIGSVVGLSYEGSTDSFWVYNRPNTFYNIDRAGNVLRTVVISGLAPFNPYGGEIAMAAPTPTQLTVTPSPATVVRGGTVQIAAHATVAAGADPAGTIAIASGAASCTIASSNGTCDLTLPALGPQTVTATFTPASPGLFLGSTAQATVTVTCPAITLTPASLPAGRAETPYAVAFGASGGLAPYTFAIDGALPSGLTLAGDTLSGTPDAAFTGSVTVRAAESGGACLGEQTYTLSIAPAVRLYTLAEGVTNGFFASFILIANPNAAEAPITLRYAGETGGTATETRTLPPFSRTTIATGEDSVAETVGATFTTRISSDTGLPLVVERATYFDASLHAGDLSTATEDTGSTTRYFAEGANGYFHTYLLLGNQSDDETAEVTMRYLPEASVGFERTYAVAPHSRVTVDTSAEPALAADAFAMALQASVPVTADRVQYFGSPFTGAHADSGAAEPSADWYFAEGAGGSAFDTYVLLGNPADAAATVTVTFHTDAGEAIARTYTVPAGARRSIDVKAEDARLAVRTFWTEAHADRPIVAERAMYVVANGAWTDATATTGARAPALRWGLAEGATGMALGYAPYVLIANPSAQAAAITVQYLRSSGDPVSHTYSIPALGRLTLDVRGEEPSLADAEFGILVSSTNNTPIIVERSQYWTLGGPGFVGAMNTMGTPLPDPDMP